MNLLKCSVCIALILNGVNLAVGQTIEHPTQDYVLRFAGEQYAVAPDDPALDLGSEFTMLGWFYFEKVTSGAILMGRLHNPFTDDPNVAYTLSVTNFEVNNQFEFLLSDGTTGSRTFLFGGAIPENQWVHVAATFGAETMHIYVNGVEQGSESFTGAPDMNATRFGIGGGVTEDVGIAYQSGFSGFMKRLSVWTIALSEASIASYAENGLTGSETGLIAYWVLNEQNSSNAPDVGSNQLHLEFSHENNVQSQDRTNDPIWYREDGIDAPYFKVTEYPWYETIGSPEYAAQDVYALDFNQDEWMDVVIGYMEWPAEETPNFTPLHALKNNGDGTFSDVTSTVLGDVQLVLGRFGKVADLNGDGYEDVFIVDTGTDCCGSPGLQNTLLLGNSEGTLTNASSTNLPDFDDANHALDIGDIDIDGDLDVISAQQGRPLYPAGSTETKPEIWINNGAGNFALDYDRWPESVDLDGGVSLALIDWDKDGWKDMLFSAQYSPAGELYPRDALVQLKNTGEGIYEFLNGDMLQSELISVESDPSFGSYIDMHVFDVNGDGWQDVIASGLHPDYLGGYLDLYLNDGEGNLVLNEGAFESPHFGARDINFWFIYLKPADFNNDGWIDIYAEGGHAGDLLFLNKGDGTFQEATFLLTPETFSFGSASAVADFTNDGRPDIFSVSSGKIQLLENMRDFTSASSILEKPLAPALTAPGNNSKATSTTILSWQENSPFALSHIQVASDEAFTNVIFDRTDYTGLQIEVSGLTEGTEYFWRVRGKNTAGTGDWSAVQSFHTNRTPVIETLEFTVEENSPVGTVIGTVTASDEDADALTFSLVSGNTNEAFAIDVATGELTVQTESALDYETTPTYDLEVEVSDGLGSQQAFVTVNLSDVDDAVLGLESDPGLFRIFPNPAKDILHIEGLTEGMQPTNVQIISLSGQLVMKRRLGKDAIVDIGSLKPGIYVLKLLDKTGEIGEMRVLKE